MARETLTKKQEDFARLLFEGLSNREAWLKAGYSTNMLPSTIDSNASRLAANSKVLARLVELRSKAEDASIASVVERKRVLTEIVRGRIKQFTSGNRINATLNDLNSAAVAEVVTSEIQIGKGDSAAIVDITKLKLRDPVAAIDTLNKMEKIYDTGAVNINIDNRQVTIIEVVRPDAPAP